MHLVCSLYKFCLADISVFHIHWVLSGTASAENALHECFVHSSSSVPVNTMATNAWLGLHAEATFYGISFVFLNW